MILEIYLYMHLLLPCCHISKIEYYKICRICDNNNLPLHVGLYAYLDITL